MAIDRNIDVSVEELVEAMNDPAQAERLLAEHNWNADDLIARAEAITKDLSDSLGKMNVV